MKLLLRVFLIVGIFVMLALTRISGVWASHTPATYNYLLATGPLCTLAEPNPCPDISKASNGDTVEIAGEGTFNTGTKVATGGGTFVHKNAAGTVLGSGTWTASELVSFRSFGNDVSEFPPNFEGGRAKLWVHLTPSSGGAGFDATLKINCIIGKHPSGSEEGVKLNVRRGPNFHDTVSGLTLFIKQ